MSKNYSSLTVDDEQPADQVTDQKPNVVEAESLINDDKKELSSSYPKDDFEDFTPKRLGIVGSTYTYLKEVIKRFVSIPSGIFFIVLFCFNNLYTGIDMNCNASRQNAKGCNDHFRETIGTRLEAMIIPAIWVIVIVHLIFASKRVSKLLLVILIYDLYHLMQDMTMTPYKYNKIFHLAFIVLTLGGLTLYSLVRVLYIVIKPRNWQYFKWYVIGLAAIVAAIFVKYETSCSSWGQGIVSKIDTSDGYCKIKEPSTCFYYLTDGWFDLTRFTSCSDPELYGTFGKVERHFRNTDGNYILYPRTQEFDEDDRFSEKAHNVIGRNVKAVEDIDFPFIEGYYEFFLNATNKDHPELLVNVKKNQELAEQRSQTASEKKLEMKNIVDNVIVIYIDAMSRAEVHLKMPLLAKWMKKQAENDQFDVNEFFRYHSVAPQTRENMLRVFFGMLPKDNLSRREQEELTRKDSFIKSFQENGWITARSADYPEMVPYYPTRHISKQVVDNKWDHEGVAYSADPNYFDPDDRYGPLNGPFSSVRRCLYGKDVNEYTIEYGRQFWSEYKDQNKLLYMDFIDAHEGTMEVVKHLDKPIAEFLEELESQGGLDNTAIMLLGDHGLHMNGVYSKNGGVQFDIERVLPAYFLLLPKSVDKDIRENVAMNQQKLVYANNIYNTFMSISEGSESQFIDDSVFGSALPADKSCRDIPLMEDTYCACE